MARNETAEGVVFRKHTKKYRGRELYSFCFDGSSDVWYRLGEDEYEGEVEEGYEIEIEFYEDRNGNLVVESVELIAEGDPVDNRKSRGGRGNSRGGSRRSNSRSTRGSGSKSGSKGRGNSGGGKQNVDWEAKDLKIQYQSARKDALLHVQTLLSNEAVELPAKTKKNERKEAINGLVDYYTALFFEDIADQSALERAQEEREAPKTTRTKSKKSSRKRREEPEDDDYDDDDDYEDDD